MNEKIETDYNFDIYNTICPKLSISKNKSDAREKIIEGISDKSIEKVDVCDYEFIDKVTEIDYKKNIIKILYKKLETEKIPDALSYLILDNFDNFQSLLADYEASNHLFIEYVLSFNRSKVGVFSDIYGLFRRNKFSEIKSLLSNSTHLESLSNLVRITNSISIYTGRTTPKEWVELSVSLSLHLSRGAVSNGVSPSEINLKKANALVKKTRISNRTLYGYDFGGVSDSVQFLHKFTLDSNKGSNLFDNLSEGNYLDSFELLFSLVDSECFDEISNQCVSLIAKILIKSKDFFDYSIFGSDESVIKNMISSLRRYSINSDSVYKGSDHEARHDFAELIEKNSMLITQDLSCVIIPSLIKMFSLKKEINFENCEKNATYKFIANTSSKEPLDLSLDEVLEMCDSFGNNCLLFLAFPNLYVSLSNTEIKDLISYMLNITEIDSKLVSVFLKVALVTDKQLNNSITEEKRATILRNIILEDSALFGNITFGKKVNLISFSKLIVNEVSRLTGSDNSFSFGVGLSPGIVLKDYEFTISFHLILKSNSHLENDSGPLSERTDVTVDKIAEMQIRDVNITGNRVFPDSRLLQVMESSTMGGYSKGELVNNLDNLTTFYRDRGFSKFRVISTQVTLSDDKSYVTIDLEISEGSQYRVGLVDVTDIRLLATQSMVTLQQGELFSNTRLRETQKNLSENLAKQGSPFAETNVIPKVNEIDKTIDLIFELKPQNRPK